jgi:hypothetical protein
LDKVIANMKFIESLDRGAAGDVFAGGAAFKVHKAKKKPSPYLQGGATTCSSAPALRRKQRRCLRRMMALPAVMKVETA